MVPPKIGATVQGLLTSAPRKRAKKLRRKAHAQKTAVRA